MARRPLGAALACSMVALSAVAAVAKPSGGGAIATIDPGNISGVWISGNFDAPRVNGRPQGRPGSAVQTLPKDADGAPVPMQPWAEELLLKRMQDAKDGHPFAHTKSRCLPAGLPKSMDPPASLPIQLLVTPGQVTVLFEEFNDFRIIRMGGKHDPDADPGYFGDSVGHWEGRTLVVDTVGLTTATTLDSIGLPHSDAMHIVERYRRTGDTLEILLTIDDPKAFTRSWTMRSILKTKPGLSLGEYFCENDRNTPDETGRTGIRLK